MNSRTIRALACLLALAAATGCASPGWRIRRNQEMFQSFPQDVQQKVRKGTIELGYTRDMVFIAMGRPHRVYERVTDAGAAEIWAYVGVRFGAHLVPVDTSYVYRDRDGEPHLAHGWTFVDAGGSDEYETLRVEFQNDKVKAIERLRR
jgi:outer membrane protein assembly factor BamE (lipoprotein component of BamABCDE complex)